MNYGNLSVYHTTKDAPKYPYLGHVANNFSISKVHTKLAVANGLRKGDHGKRHGRVVVEHDIDDLVIADVVGKLVHAATVRCIVERLLDAFDRRRTVCQDFYGPRCVPALDGVVVN